MPTHAAAVGPGVEKFGFLKSTPVKLKITPYYPLASLSMQVAGATIFYHYKLNRRYVSRNVSMFFLVRDATQVT